MSIKEMYQSADWKSEKHVPVIEGPDKVKKGEWVRLKLSVGKEIPHPNKTDHFISWIHVHFLPQGEKFPYEIAAMEFSAHGASIKGPDTSSVYTHPEVIAVFKTDKPGTVMATAYCNIHGLWESSKDLMVE